ncbi:DUF2218 domain-containing protein [Streptomyces sp. CdTB01]|uniref:DUF2218 domain-containing protein n=1 Tax=Streptomyces sp. CdTB01 TaxID=1725411 RepID=UPI0007C78E65|nr:DUF2218 domain-containing protein [Streptomyces sp. CdTB01]
MPTAEARVETDRPSRYLVQLCKHFSNKGRHLGQRAHAHSGGDAQALRDMRAVAEQAQVEWSDTEGEVSLPWGRIILQAAPGALTMHVEAVTEEDLGRLQDLVAGHIERFGRRDGLRVSWQRPESPAFFPEASVGTAGAPGGGAVQRRRHLKAIGLAAVVALVLLVHLGLGGAVLANWRWTGWTVGAVLAVVLVKVVLLGGFAVRRGRATKSR